MKIKIKIKNKLNGLARRSYWFNEIVFPDCMKFWKHNTFNLDVVNLGSTSALRAFNYEGIPLRTANWAIGHNPILGDFEVLNNYVSFLNSKGATVIITLCPFTSLSGSYDYFEDRYYSFLNILSIPHGAVRKKAEVLRMKKNPWDYYPLHFMMTDLKRLFFKKKHPNITEEWMRKDAERMMDSWMKEFSVTDFSYPMSMVNRDGIEDAARTLNKIIEFCQKRNLRPVLLIPPVYHTLGKLFTPEIRNIVIDSLIEKVEDKTVWYHNYMDDLEFTKDCSLFQSSFLMNNAGAKLFTRRVLCDLDLLK